MLTSGRLSDVEVWTCRTVIGALVDECGVRTLQAIQLSNILRETSMFSSHGALRFQLIYVEAHGVHKRRRTTTTHSHKVHKSLFAEVWHAFS